MDPSKAETQFRSLADIPQAYFSVLSLRLANALASPTASALSAQEKTLSGLIRKTLGAASPELFQIASSHDASTVTGQAFVLGKLSFAQQLSAHVATKRVGDDFMKIIKSGIWRAFLCEFERGERTNSQLAQSLKMDVATISRKVRELRHAGVTDFRKEGIYVFNFLTPAAQQYLDSEHKIADQNALVQHDKGREKVDELMQKVTGDVDDYMRHQLAFIVKSQ